MLLTDEIKLTAHADDIKLNIKNTFHLNKKQFILYFLIFTQFIL